MLTQRFLEAALLRAKIDRNQWEEMVDCIRFRRKGRFSAAGLTTEKRYKKRTLEDIVDPEDPIPIWEGPVNPKVGATWCLGPVDSKLEEMLCRFRLSDFEGQSFRMLQNLSIALATNLLLWEVATGESLVPLWKLGMFNSNSRFISTAKEVNLVAKDFGLKGKNRPYMEMQALAGYQLASDEERMEELNTELEEMIDAPPSYVDGYEELYRANYPRYSYRQAPPKMGLKDFVRSKAWMADGGAAMTGGGKVEAEVYGVKTRLRLTKKRIPLVMEFEELWTMVKNRLGSCYVEAIIKSEPQKQRWIFNVDTACNILLSYGVSSLSEYNLECHSSGENFGELVTRLFTSLTMTSRDAYSRARLALGTMLPLLEKLGFTPGLSYPVDGVYWMGDINKFDHSISKWQIDLWNRTLMRADLFPDQIRRAFLSTTEECYLLNPRLSQQDKTRVKRELNRLTKIGVVKRDQMAYDVWLKVKSGLMSGLRTTSLLGSDVNGRNCLLARDMLNELVGRRVIDYVGVRGDDSLVWAESKIAALCYHILVGGMTDLSVQKSRISKTGEFLRLQFLPDVSLDEGFGVVGIISRAVATTGQRKPISTEVSSRYLNSSVEAIENAACVMRRGGADDFYRLVFDSAYKACDKYGIPREFVHAPKSVGGLGLGEVSCTTWRTPRAEGARFTHHSAWALAEVKEKFSKYSVTDAEAAQLLDNSVLSALETSDDPEVKRVMRSNRSKPTLSRRYPKPLVKPLVDGDIEAAASWFSSSDFGKFPDVSERISLAGELSRVRGIPMIDLLSAYDKRILLKIEKRYRFPRSVAVDWLSGRVSYNSNLANPELARAVNIVTAYLFSRWGPRDSNLVRFWIAQCGWEVGNALQGKSAVLFSW